MKAKEGAWRGVRGRRREGEEVEAVAGAIEGGMGERSVRKKA